MAPFKSSLARSAGKLLGVFRERDLSLRGATQSIRIPPFAASGGNIDAVTPGDGYTYHLFNATGSLVMPEPYNIEVLLIGGGGSGGAFGPPNGAAGGGAGGVVHHSQLSASGTLTINVGDGGGPVALSTKDDGDDSTIVSPAGPWTITAKGGGAGGYYATAGNPGGSGGGGGGNGGGYSNTHTTSTQAPQNPSFVPQTGFNQYGSGGGAPSDNNPGKAGGGGGAGGVGGSSPEAEGAPGVSAGGDGRAFPSFPGALPGFTPMPTTWKNTVGPTGLFAGGGSGESPYGSATPTSAAGSGGGGGYFPGPETFVADGVANTGGGGAGTNAAPGGVGGKGICIIRYQG